MATLTFNLKNGIYVAETTVNADYNLHIERVGGGRFNIYQRGAATGEYVSCVGLPTQLVYSAPKVIDWDFSHGVYPKYLRIESETQVTSAEITEAKQ